MRFTLSLEGKAEERLAKWTANGESKADVLRSAMALEDIFREADRRGAKLLVQEPDGTVKELIRA